MSEDSNRAEEALLFVQALDSQRASWDGYWQDLADVIHPRRHLVNNAPQPNQPPDQTDVARNFDGTAMRANRTLANGQASRITPMGARWFALRAPDELQRFPAVVRWYQEAGEIAARYLEKSNGYNRFHQHYLDRGCFGTAATEILPGDNSRGVHFRQLEVGTYSIAHNHLDEVDTIAVTRYYTPAQLVQTFERIPESVSKMLENPRERIRPLEVVHLVRPRPRHLVDPRKTGSRNMRFESLHILKRDKVILAEGGFQEFPFAVSRWELWGGSPYGWSPGHLALPEANQANFLEEMLDHLAEVQAFPRVLYPSNLLGDVDFGALGLTCYDPSNGNKPEEWLSQGRYDVGKDRLRDKREAINESFFVPLFSAISQLDRDATATEVRAIITETRELFHPIFANLVREFLQPMLRRTFALLLRQGAFPPPPTAAYQSNGLTAFISDPEVEFTSSMALALEQSQLANFGDAIATLSPVAELHPDAFDFINTDAIGPAFFRYKGLPADFIRPPEEIARIRAQRAAAQQAATLKDAAQTIGPDNVAKLAQGLG